MSDIKRREFAALVGGAALLLAAGVRRARAQQPAGRLRHIGLLHPGTPPNPNVEAFRQGLRDLGYVDGQNIVIEYRWAEGMLDPLPSFAAELVRLNVDLIVTEGLPSARALKKATSTIPIVVARAGDLVGSGLVGSLARPGGNITGFSILGPELAGKRLELLKEIVPDLSHVTVVSNPANPHRELEFGWAEKAAQTLPIKLQLLGLHDPNEFEGTFSSPTQERAGFVVLGDPLLISHRAEIADLATKSRVPTISDRREFVEAGCLMSFGPNSDDLYRRAASYVDKILKGAKPADLPVQQPTRFELVINLKTARAVGIEIPPTLLVLANEVIE
jgi:putative tryptophan/tyrosine transport system substrate-binding protein